MPNEKETLALDALQLSTDVDEALLQLTARRALSEEFDNGRDTPALRTAQEQLRGKQTLLKNINKTLENDAYLALSRQFNPDHVERQAPYHITPEERARRDAYRNNFVVNWSKLDRG